MKLFQKGAIEPSLEQILWSKCRIISKIAFTRLNRSIKTCFLVLFINCSTFEMTLNNPPGYLLYFLHAAIFRMPRASVAGELLDNIDRSNPFIILFPFRHSVNRAYANQRCLDARIF